MAETSERTLLREASVRPGGLLTTKLHAPRPPAGFVRRQRLVDRLDEGMTRELTLVCAPAGFGKTSLLADWIQPRQRPVAWLSLDSSDNDPVRFWRYTLAALDRVRPGVAERVSPLLGPPAPASFEGLVTAVLNELSADDEALLVLDDYHLIEAQAVHSSLQFLIDHQPPGLQVVLAGRADPQLPLARLRARGQLAELRAAELVFTVEEAASLLGEAAGSQLREDTVKALVARTEGWAAGLQLAALSLPTQPDVDGFAESFSGSHRYVLDYLTEEVLAQQPEPVRAFLLETSVLDRLSGSLCDAVAGRTDGQAMLEAIERANLFLVPLDEVRGWWRYHHLFADLLRARLQQQQPERLGELHRNAASWHEDRGLIDDSIRHALAAEDAARAARLVEQHIEALYVRSEDATAQRWLVALPPELVESRPRLLLAQVRAAVRGGDVEGGEDLLRAAERAFAQAADEPYEPSVGRAASRANIPATIALAHARIAYLRGDPEETIEHASRVLTEIGEGDWMLDTLARWHLTAADWLRGRLSEAERGFASGVGRWPAAGDPALTAEASWYLGQVQRDRGRLDAALATHQHILHAAEASHRVRPPYLGSAHVGIAQVAYQRDELDIALRHLTEGLALSRQLGDPQPLATGLATLAWIRHIEGNATAALDAIEEAERVAPSPAVADLHNPVPAQRARLLLVCGDVAAAARWTEQRGLTADDEASYPREPAYLVLARVLLAQDLPDRALRLLDRLQVDASAHERIGSLIEIQALRALALAASGDEAGAVDTLAAALTLAHPQRYVRVFADEGPPMAALLGRLIATQRSEPRATKAIPVDYLGRLLRTFDQDAARGAVEAAPGRAVVAGPVTALSDRELEVLRLVAAGKPNRQIADELYVSIHTVKKHVTHILDKLGAANRTEVTARARELGLLP
jgi:ATP/maltotriose-dependent transcriptional regulator MalT